MVRPYFLIMLKNKCKAISMYVLVYINVVTSNHSKAYFITVRNP